MAKGMDNLENISHYGVEYLDWDVDAGDFAVMKG